MHYFVYVVLYYQGCHQCNCVHLCLGISMHCVKEEHTAINMNLHYLDNGTVMLNFIYQKELFFLPLGFALKVTCTCFYEW